jgi:hypothetical protein
MKKIAYVVHAGDTNGGFPQHSEIIIKTLKELGNIVDFYYLQYRSSPSKRIEEKIEILNSTNGVGNKDGKTILFDKGEGTGLWFEPESGWVHNGFCYKEKEQKIQFRNKMEEYDGVFWHTPFWFKQNSTLKDTDWPIMLDAKNPVQVGMVHDANLRSNCAWIHFIEEKFDYILTVHPASYNSASVLRTPRVMIFNPQDLSMIDRNRSGYDSFNDPTLFILQNWKSSKRGADFIRAIPYLNDSIKSYIGGGGIEWRYMNSEEKCKSIYYSSELSDPNRSDLWNKRIIDNAKTHPGFEYLGWITEKTRDEILSRTSFFIDPAWYKINYTLGAHFSRTLIEAMKFGVVPIARGLGLSNNDEGKGDVFNSGINYINVPSNSSPEEFANIIEDSLKMSENEYNKIVNNNYEILKNFDRFNVAKEYLKLLDGEPCGWYNKFEVGNPTYDFIQKANSQWYGTGDKRTFFFKEKRKKVLF